MTIQSSIQKGVSNFSYIIGLGMVYGGGTTLLIMAAVGTVAIDLVLLAYAEKNKDAFLTGFILGSLFFGQKVDPVPLLIASPITSVIAIGLSLMLGVPGVGLAILAGWTFGALMLGVGYGLVALSNALEPEPNFEEFAQPSIYAFN